MDVGSQGDVANVFADLLERAARLCEPFGVGDICITAEETALSKF